MQENNNEIKEIEIAEVQEDLYANCCGLVGEIG